MAEATTKITRTPTLANRIPSPTESAAIRNDLLSSASAALDSAPTTRDVDMQWSMLMGRITESYVRGLLTAEDSHYVEQRIKSFAEAARRNLEARVRQVRAASAA